MTGDTYPRFRAAAVQAAPVFLDRAATIEKAEGLVAEAADRGADLVVFGESFVPAFPLWNMLLPPLDQHPFFRRMYDNALTVPGRESAKLAGLAKKYGIFLSIGVTEKGRVTMGTLWNSNLLFDPKGRLVNHRRKLVPTWAEKLTWGDGDGSSLSPVETELGRLGVLICGENTNPLARYAMLAQGEQVHISTFPPCWPTKREGKGYDLTEAIRIRACAHAFEGKVFNVVASCALDDGAVEELSLGDERVAGALRSAPPASSFIVGPSGRTEGQPVVGKEGMVVGEIDLSRSVEEKQYHDVLGHYNRFDIFRLEMSPVRHSPMWVRESGVATPVEEYATGAVAGKRRKGRKGHAPPRGEASLERRPDPR
ncbi:MAG: carbon-nitrogen hydrolase family protein [Nitrososphaerota archaeon]|nr:carbon-nitrogen hydrolase family protein [Nitrososphaerota archaeon]